MVTNDFKVSTDTNHPESEDRLFSFGIDLLDASIIAIHKCTVSSHRQISAIVLLDIAYTLAYAGSTITAFYLFDFSSTATGKDSAAEKSYELHLKPIMKLQSQKKRDYTLECEISTVPLSPKSFHCIHTSDATPQGTYRGFDTTKAQYVRLGEIGIKMKNKEHPLMNFVTDSYGKHTLIQPNYKKDLGGAEELQVEDISLFFYGNSNIQMLGMNTLLHHLQGGLLNRCVLVYNQQQRPFDKRPHDFYLADKFITTINEKIEELIKFYQTSMLDIKPIIPRTQEYEDFDRYIFDRTKQIANTGVQDIFKRTMQNLNAIISTLHYLHCFENGLIETQVAEETVHLGIRYMLYIIDGYDALIDEVIGASQEERDDINIEKIKKVIKDLSRAGKTSAEHRYIYRKLHINRKYYDLLLEKMHYKHDERVLHFLPETV